MSWVLIRLLSRESSPPMGSFPGGYEEASYHQSLEAQFAKLRLVTLPPNTLISLDELPFDIKKLPRTFSSFRRKIEKIPLQSYRFSQWEFRQNLTPGRKRLHHYLHESRLVEHYKETRNGLGPGDYSSGFSTFLATDQLLAKEIGAAVLDFEQKFIKNESTYWLIFEMLWRDFFFFLSLKYPKKTYYPTGTKKVRSQGLGDDLKWRYHHNGTRVEPLEHEDIIEDYWGRFRSWVRGKTKEPFINACMLELHATGKSSNRSRQNAASYLIYNLGVPWWWGAQWFEYCLLDYHAPSNWGNWAYLAGVGADPQEKRRFNTKKQAEIYDPENQYQDWVNSQGFEVPEDVLPMEPPPGVYP